MRPPTYFAALVLIFSYSDSAVAAEKRDKG